MWGVITWKMEKGMDRWEALTEHIHPAEDHSKWGTCMRLGVLTGGPC